MDARVVRQMRGADLGASHEPPYRLGRLDLAAVATKRWIRGSNGVSEPLAASVDRAPVTRPIWNRRSASKSPASAYAVENCVPLSSASPSFGPSLSGSSPAAARASLPAQRVPRPGSRLPRSSPRPCVPAGPDRRRRRPSPERHNRGEIRMKQGLEHRNGRRPYARGALGQAGELERHHQPNDRCGRRFPTPAACDSTILRCNDSGRPSRS